MPTVCWLLYILVVGLSNGVTACYNTEVRTQDQAIDSGSVDDAVDEPSDDEERDIEFPSAGTDTIDVKWKAPDETQGKIRSYQVTATNEETGEQVKEETTSNEITLTNLSPFTVYNISVKTVGSEAVTGRAMTLPLPGQKVQDVRFPDIGKDFISVQWRAPEKKYGEIRAYYVEATDMATQNGKGIQAQSTRTKFTGFTPNTKYKISVRTVNEPNAFYKLGGGAGEAVINIVQTLPAVGQPVTGLQSSHIGNDTFTVKWSAPDEPQGEIQSYHVTATNLATGQQLKEKTTSKEATFSNLSPAMYFMVSVSTENKQLNGESDGVGEAVTIYIRTLPIAMA